HDLHGAGQGVAGAHRMAPAQVLDAGRPTPVEVAQRLDRQAREDGRGVPSAGDEAPERAAGGSLLVDVERLGIEAPRELEDLGTVDGVAAELHGRARIVVFEPPRHCLPPSPSCTYRMLSTALPSPCEVAHGCAGCRACRWWGGDPGCGGVVWGAAGGFSGASVGGGAADACGGCGVAAGVVGSLR